MKNLKDIACYVREDIAFNGEWFEKEVSFVLDGSHSSGYTTREHILKVVDTTKKNYGKRGNNLIAFCGNQALQDIYSVSRNQALNIWKYFSIQEQKYLSALIRDLLENIEEENNND
jgi:hypothetical protein